MTDDRTKLLELAVAFLRAVRGGPTTYQHKIEFLQEKGLQDHEIVRAFLDAYQETVQIRTDDTPPDPENLN